MLAAVRDRTQCRPTTDTALMKWSVRRAACFNPRFKSTMHSPRSTVRWMGGPHRGRMLEFGESVVMPWIFMRLRARGALRQSHNRQE